MSKQTAFDKVSLLGVDIDTLSINDAIGYICNRAAGNQPSGYVVKPYVEFLDRAGRQPDLKPLLNDAELVLADGVALIWAAAFLYAGPRNAWRFWLTLVEIVVAPSRLRWPLPDRLAGTNFTWPLLDAARDHQLRVYLIGKETPEAIQAVAARITEHTSGIVIAGTKSGIDPSSPRGQVSPAWLSQTATDIAAVKPDLILVGMGFPLQENVCAYLANRLNHGVFIGEGGTFDYESFGGQRRKAPGWVQRIGLEWAWRLVLEPQRLKRQLAIPRFIWRIWRSR